MKDSPRLITVVFEVAKLDSAVRLYREAFGLDLQPSEHSDDNRWIGGRHAAVSWSQGAFIHFALYESKGEITTHAQIGFRVDDLDRAHERAVSAGVEVLHPPVSQPWGRSARYRDTDGNVVELTAGA